MENGQSIKAVNYPQARIGYDDRLCSWSDTKTTKPYTVFWQGSACNSFATLDEAKQNLNKKAKHFLKLTLVWE